MGRQAILRQIDAEREYQETRWGPEFDNKNTINDWTAYIARYAGRASDVAFPAEAYRQRAELIKVAALAVAAVEACDRNAGFPSRHYD